MSIDSQRHMQGFKIRFRSWFRKITLMQKSRSISRQRAKDMARSTQKPFQCGRFLTVLPHFESMVTHAYTRTHVLARTRIYIYAWQSFDLARKPRLDLRSVVPRTWNPGIIMVVVLGLVWLILNLNKIVFIYEVEVWSTMVWVLQVGFSPCCEELV